MGLLYDTEELKRIIPDPSLVAAKAAVNWSGRTPQTRERKLLPACTPPEEEFDDSAFYSTCPSILSFSEPFLQAKGVSSRENYEKEIAVRCGDRLQADLMHLVVEFATNDKSNSKDTSTFSDDLSELGDDCSVGSL
jgi:hypothetical protein